jgi:hypothetical protein
MSQFPAILAALFGVPSLTSKKVQGALDEGGNGNKSLGERFNEFNQRPWSFEWIKDIIGKLKDNWKDTEKRLNGLMVISVLIGFLLLLAAAILALVYYLQIQLILYKRSSEDPNQALLNAKRPYKDTMEYQVMNPSIFTKYSYRGIFYLSAVAFTLMILAYLFKIQLGMNSTSGTAPNPFEEARDKPILLGLIASLYVFGLGYWFIEKKYYTEIVQYNAKIADFNQFVRSILPGNYKFLTVISAVPKDSSSIDSTYIDALENLNPNKREMIRAMCVLNLYTYYIENRQLYTDAGGVNDVLSCFNPINRIIPVAGSTACFSDHLINTHTYIDNRIGKYVSLIESMDSEKSFVKDIFMKRRTEIMVEVDKIMSELNQRGSCLGSGTAYNKFLRMNTQVFVFIWIPLLLVLFWGSGSAIKSIVPK